MKKLLIAGCALAVVGLTGSAQAAPAKNPMCSLPVPLAVQSWNDSYGCWGWTYGGKMAPAPVAHPVSAKRDPMCSLPVPLAVVSWNDRYSCWR